MSNKRINQLLDLIDNLTNELRTLTNGTLYNDAAREVDSGACSAPTERANTPTTIQDAIQCFHTWYIWVDHRSGHSRTECTICGVLQ